MTADRPLSTKEAVALLGIADRTFRRRFAPVLPHIPGDHGVKFYHRHDILARAADLGIAVPDALIGPDRPADSDPATALTPIMPAAMLLLGALQRADAERLRAVAERDAAAEKERVALVEIGRLQQQLKNYTERGFWRRLFGT